MPPVVRVTKERIVQAAVNLTRQQGYEKLNARRLANEIGCSTQPIFSNFASMNEVRAALLQECVRLYKQAMAREVSAGRYPPYKAQGMAYIRFAAAEPQLFHLLFMRDRRGADDDGLTEALYLPMQRQVQQTTGLDEAEASLFHLEMWAVVHGLAVMNATGYQPLEEELVSRMLTDLYQGLLSRKEKDEWKPSAAKD